MSKKTNVQFLVRICMVIIVLIGVGLFLYAPRILYFLRKEKSITVLTWPQVIDASYLREFEDKTGIKVYIRYFENNGELLTKLESTGGQGYDLIMPTDYAAQQLIKKGLIKKLDKTKLNFWHTLYPALLGHYYDPNNEYTIPFFWGIEGIGFDKDYFAGKKIPLSWSLLFDPRIVPSRIGMVDEARILILVAAYYLFGTIDNLTDQHISRIKRLLLDQKKRVHIYTDLRSEYLLASKTCPVVLISSADVARVLPYFDHVGFIVPHEGSFLSIDSFALSATSDKDEFVYPFLNYIYRADVLQYYVNKFNFFPPTMNVQSAFKYKGISVPTKRMIQKLHFFRNVLPERVLNEIWIALKA